MPSWQQDIEHGQKLWSSKYYSGKIVQIDWANRCVVVTFWEKGHKTYEFNQLEGNWADHSGGTWIIEEDL